MNSNEETARGRNYVHPRVPTSLVSQIDQTIKTAQEFGMPKYASRNEFIEAAIRGLLFKERRKVSA